MFIPRLFKLAFGMGIDPVTGLGLAAMAGGAGFGLSQLRKKPQLRQIDPGIKPYMSQTQFPVGSALNERILGQLGGEGIGFPEGFTDRTTSPFVEQLRADFPQAQQDIQAGFGGAGLGRSSLAGRALGEARQQHGRDINQLMAEAELRGLAQQKEDEARAEQQAGAFSGREISTRNAAAQFGLGVDTTNLGQQNIFDTAQRQQRDLEIGLPLQMGGSVLGGNVGGAFNLAGGSLGGQNNLADLIAERNRRRAFTGTGA